MLADQPYLSIPQVADALGVGGTTVRRWIKQGRLTVVTLPSGRHRIPREQVEAILAPTRLEPTAGAA